MFDSINVVTLRYARLVPEWVTVFGRAHGRITRHRGLLSLSPPSVVKLEWVLGEGWESKQAYRVIHQPVSVVLQCSLMPGWKDGLQRSASTYGKR